MAALTLPTHHEAIDAALLPEIVRLYLAAKAPVVTPDTLDTYAIHLRPFLVWWESCAHAHNGQLSPAILKHAEAWIRTEYRTSRGTLPQPNTIAHCWSQTRQMFHWAFQQNCTGTIDIASWCPDTTLVQPSVHFPTVAELARILAAPNDELRLRDVALLAFLVSTGARRYEVSMAQVEAIEWQAPVTNLDATADQRGWVLLRKQKGDREGLGVGRPVVFGQHAGLLLKAYLRSVNRTNGSIFGLSDTGIAQMVEKHALAAGARELSPHGFRRMMADFWDETHGLEGRAALKRQLGHSLRGDVTEAHYLSRNVARIARDILKWHVSPLTLVPWDWSKFPVHIPPVGT